MCGERCSFVNAKLQTELGHYGIRSELPTINGPLALAQSRIWLPEVIFSVGDTQGLSEKLADASLTGCRLYGFSGRLLM